MTARDFVFIAIVALGSAAALTWAILWVVYKFGNYNGNREEEE